MKVLVVVDMQNDFITGSLGTPEAQAIVPNVKKKVEAAVENGDVIVYTRDTHFDNYLETKEGKALPVKHCISGTTGWRIPDELLPPDEYCRMFIVDKHTFGHYELPATVRSAIKSINNSLECDGIELLGLCTEICVVSNALLLKSFFYSEYDISVDATCCAGVTLETHEAALKTMEMCQINVTR